jgi:uncharacterized protein with PQ loop repeat
MDNCATHENGLALINWIYFMAGSCVYGHLSEFSWVASTISVSGWILAGLYQIFLCYRSKEASGFSPLFLLCWVVGDVTNVIGTYLTNQMRFQRVLSASSLVLDGTLLMQYVYYGSCYKREDMFIDTPVIRSSPSPITVGLVATAYASRVVAAPLPAATTGFPTILVVEETTAHAIGKVCTWICSTLYLVSTIPQIFKNYHAKSTGGVSMSLFLADTVGNFGYSASIFAAAQAMDDPIRRKIFLAEERPYFTGTGITFLLELILFYQYFYYWNNDSKTLDCGRLFYDGLDLETDTLVDDDDTTPLKAGKVDYKAIEVY